MFNIQINGSLSCNSIMCVCMYVCARAILTVTYSESISFQNLATCVSWVAFNITKDGQQVSRYVAYRSIVYSVENEGREKERMPVFGSACGKNISFCGYSFTSDCV